MFRVRLLCMPVHQNDSCIIMHNVQNHSLRRRNIPYLNLFLSISSSQCLCFLRRNVMGNVPPSPNVN